ncbi:MAG: zf-TFIIB domain-containing protein [Pirellulales bacterium]|nr:zf-TFIIB domain-containing protein [Pirellulales bacterium]
MKCPNCNLQLRRILYEGMPVFRCMRCHGYLLGERRLEGIKSSPLTSIEQLKQEVINEAQADTEKPIRCPRCLRKMEKRFIEEPAALHVDACRECGHVWLDGGELARLQLSHEMQPQAQEARRFRERIRSMTAEEKATFEANIKKLPKEERSVPILLEMLFGHRRDRLR